jgi:hypothetical protein
MQTTHHMEAECAEGDSQQQRNGNAAPHPWHLIKTLLCVKTSR